MALFPTLASQMKRLATVRLLPDVINALNLLVKALSGSFTLPATDFSDAVIIEKDAAGGFNPALTVQNDNAGASASASIKLVTNGGGSGDPFIILTNGTTTWSLGLDNSATDNFVIARSAALGGTDAVRIDASTNALQVAGRLLLFSATANTITIQHAATTARTVTLQDLDGVVALLGALNVGHLLFADNQYDLGSITPSLARPRDLFLARNATVGGTLTVTGTALVNGAPLAVAPLFAAASADLTLTTSYVDVPGCVVTALQPGNYRVTGTFDFRNTVTGDQGQLLLGQLVVGAGATVVGGVSSVAIFGVPTASGGTLTGARATVSQTWLVTVASGTPTFKLQAEKTGGSGTSIVGITHTAICAEFIGKP